MFKKFITLTLIFIGLNILGAETKVQAEVEQNYVEVNTENLKYLKDILTKNGLNVEALHTYVFDYLREYKLIESFKYESIVSGIKCVLPNDNVVVRGIGEIQIFHTNGSCVNRLKDIKFKINRVCVLENNLLAVGFGNLIQIYDLDFNFIKTLIGHDSDINCLYALGYNKLASCSEDSAIKIWDIDSGNCLQTILDLSNKNNCDKKYQLCLMQDGSLASICDHRIIQMWDINSGKLLQTLELEFPFLSFLSNDKLVYADLFKIIIFDIKSQEIINILKGHSGWIEHVCLLSNNLLASCSDDKTIRIWDINSGECLEVLDIKDVNITSPYALNDKITSLCALSSGKFVTTNYQIENSVKVNIWTPTFDFIKTKAVS